MILVVDDDRPSREVLGELLSEEGYSVRLAENGRHACDEIRRRAPSLLLTDYEMPHLDGEQLIGWVRPRLPLLPILMLTSRLVPSPDREIARLGIQGFFYKPIDFDELRCVIASLLREHALPP